jgi:hypothetical protein
VAIPVKNSRPTAKRTVSQKAKAASAEAKSSRRTAVVLFTLFGMLAFTGALLKALDPGPLAPDASTSLFAIGGDQSIERVFETHPPLQAGRWQHIYIHQSLSASGNAMTLGQGVAGLPDHFVIGNGDGCADGEVQIGQRWSKQQSAGVVPGTNGIKSDTISICVVGDFNRDRPTATQQSRLVQLVSALQRQLDIASGDVVMLTDTPSAAGTGARFPADAILSLISR